VSTLTQVSTSVLFYTALSQGTTTLLFNTTLVQGTTSVLCNITVTTLAYGTITLLCHTIVSTLAEGTTTLLCNTIVSTLSQGTTMLLWNTTLMLAEGITALLCYSSVHTDLGTITVLCSTTLCQTRTTLFEIVHCSQWLGEPPLCFFNSTLFTWAVWPTTLLCNTTLSKVALELPVCFVIPFCGCWLSGPLLFLVVLQCSHFLWE